VELVKKVLGSLDKQFAKILEAYVNNGQIDVFPKKGKSGGAFCTIDLLFHPTYILLNYAGTLNDVRTIAHEVGHGINNELMKERQNALNFGTPKSTAEVASTFMEDFVLRELEKEADDELKLAILMSKIGDNVSTIFRQIAFYNFERELHDSFRKKGYLSKEEIGALFQKHMVSYMGDYVEQSPGAENWWMYISHFRYIFYVYSYASGLLISKALQEMVRKDPSSIEKVKEFLGAGTYQSPKDIFMYLGIDITKKEFWDEGLDGVQSLLNEAEALAKKLGKI
jgi:oligoendopeptidase F